MVKHNALHSKFDWTLLIEYYHTTAVMMEKMMMIQIKMDHTCLMMMMMLIWWWQDNVLKNRFNCFNWMTYQKLLYSDNSRKSVNRIRMEQTNQGNLIIIANVSPTSRPTEVCNWLNYWQHLYEDKQDWGNGEKNMQQYGKHGSDNYSNQVLV